MNNQFTDEQIKAYASAFETGDAIWCDNEWHEVFYEGGFSIASPNQYHIKNLYGEGVVNGFKNVLESSGVPYRVTTLEDYKLQGGEKAVWLGIEESSVAQRTFGKVYDIFHDSSGEIFYRDDNETCYEIKSSNWGVIPTYEQVVPQETQPQQEDSSLTILEQKLMELRKEQNELQKDILEKQSHERKLAEVVINLEEAIDSLKKTEDK